MNKNTTELDLFGNPIVKDVILRDKFIEPPFSVINTIGKNWLRRKKNWKSLGLRSEVGRTAKAYNFGDFYKNKTKAKGKKNAAISDTSIFDPCLAEVLYHWFTPKGGTILDPFAGGSVRGIVANYLGYNYTGIDIREEQITSNYEQADEIIPGKKPNWITGDSNKVLDDIPDESFDSIMTCPPYANLEVYSKLDGDISNKKYPVFLEMYESIISKSIDKLKPGMYWTIVVGEVRGKNGVYLGFVPDTINIFKKYGMEFYNEAILATSQATACMRADGNMKSGKLVKIHQNILVFRKPVK